MFSPSCLRTDVVTTNASIQKLGSMRIGTGTLVIVGRSRCIWSGSEAHRSAQNNSLEAIADGARIANKVV